MSLFLLAFVAAVVGGLYYGFEAVRGRIAPHSLSWFCWFLIQVAAVWVYFHTRPEFSWVITIPALICLILFLISLPYGYRHISRFDWGCVVLVAIAIPVVIFVRDPLVFAVYISALDCIAFLPTIRKSWKEPRSEALFFYIMAGIGCAGAVFALNTHPAYEWIYLLEQAIADVLFAVLLVMRRMLVSSYESTHV